MITKAVSHSSVIRPEPRRKASGNIANNLFKCLKVKITKRPTSKGTLSQVSTLVLAFGWPYGPCPQADTQPDTWVDNRSHIPFSVGLIYLISTSEMNITLCKWGLRISTASSQRVQSSLVNNVSVGRTSFF